MSGTNNYLKVNGCQSNFRYYVKTIALRCGSINKFTFEAKKFLQMLTRRFIGQTYNKYGTEHSRNKEREPQNIVLGGIANQIHVIQKACQ